MSKIIGFGRCSKYYIYILFTVILKAVKDIIYGFSDIDQRIKEDFLIIDPTPLFCKHNLLQNLFRYIGLILGGYIFEKIREKKNKTTKDNLTEIEDGSTKLELIFTEVQLKEIKISDIIVICLIVCIYYELRKLLYLMNFFFIEFWTFDVLFVIFFMKKYFNIVLYKYQKLSLFFIVVSNTILLIANILIPQDRENGKNELDLYKDSLGNAALCIPFLLAFLLLSFFISYTRVKIKLLTHIEFLSNYIIIFYIGICGIILTLVEIAFSESLKCHPEEMNDAFKTLCLVTTTDNELYHDNIRAFFVQLGDLSALDVFINILLILFYPIISFFEILCELLIIYYLNPIYILIRENIYYFFLRIIFVLLRVNDDIKEYMTPRFFILESAEILALLGYCVYLQLIELKFCKFDLDLDKNIINRSYRETAIFPMSDITRKDTDPINLITEDIINDAQINNDNDTNDGSIYN